MSECLTLVRWSQRGLADVLECDNRLVRRWAAGESEIPAGVASTIVSTDAEARGRMGSHYVGGK